MTTGAIASPRATRPDPLRGALRTRARPARPGAATAALAFAWRGMLKIKHVPEQLMNATIGPVLFLVMFTYLFGGAVGGSTGDYLHFLVPGILVVQVLWTTMDSGVSVHTDVARSVVDRFRSLPIARSAPLTGAALGDCARYLLTGAVVVTLGAALGYRPGGGVAGVLAALALVVVFAFAVSWIFTTIGLLVRTPNAVINAGYVALFPLSFVSNAFVDPATLPSGLEAMVEVNPVTHLVTAVRGLTDGTASPAEVLPVLALAVLITAAFAPLTTRLYGGRER